MHVSDRARPCARCYCMCTIAMQCAAARACRYHAPRACCCRTPYCRTCAITVCAYRLQRWCATVAQPVAAYILLRGASDHGALCVHRPTHLCARPTMVPHTIASFAPVCWCQYLAWPFEHQAMPFLLQSFGHTSANSRLAQQRHQFVPTQNPANGTMTNHPHLKISTSSEEGMIDIGLPL